MRTHSKVPTTVLTIYTEKSAPFLYRARLEALRRGGDRFTISMALAIWCLHTPPPRMIMPAFLDARARSFKALISRTISIIRPGDRKEWKYIMSPIEPSVSAGQKTGISF
jgi:hypothetical protein